MIKKLFLLSLLVGLFCIIILPVWAADAQYVGAEKCMMCHKHEKRGDQWGKWSTGPHAKAFEILKTEESVTIAKKMGIDDPTTADTCLKCHVTAHAAPATAKQDTFDPTEGVGCEACHGPGSLYKSMRVMNALAEGTQDAEAVAFVNGDEETCLTCHNEESPTYKPFDFKKDWGKIAHNYPE